MEKNKFYVTTPIYYVTAKPHLGSLYSTLIADVLARWHKILGKKTFFLTGTDEHGQKIALAAQHAGKQPKQFVDSFIDVYKAVWKEYELEYNYFIRTTDVDHVQAIQLWLQKLIDQGDIYKSFYKGWYCVSDETFVTEGHESSEQKAAPLCPSCGRVTIEISEESYFFRLSAYQEKLLQFYQDHPDFIIPRERAHEVINFVQSGLKDLSISRTTLTWGIPFPNDEKHVTYVWADALNNYITAIGYGKAHKTEEFSYWWPADVQVLGKDIIRFHAIYWPAFLMASGLPLPHHLLVHGWIKVNQQKMSKSLGNVVDPQVLYQQYGAEPVRYYLMRQMAVNQDTDFNIEDLEQRISADLANDLGNLLNRMTSLAERYKVFKVIPPSIWSEKSLQLRDNCWNVLNEFQEYMHECSFHMALATLWKFIAQVNAYFHAQEPWKLASSNQKHFLEVISATCHSLHIIATVLWPIMPTKMEQLLLSLGTKIVLGQNLFNELTTNPWNHTFMLEKIPNLFEKPEEKKEIDASSNSTKIQEQLDLIEITDFAKVKLCVGTVEQCEAVPKSNKLYRLLVNFGPLGTRQILSGVREHFKPEDLLNKQGLFVINLAPRMMMGLESHGMMLFAPDAHGKNQIVMPEHSVPNGTQLR